MDDAPGTLASSRQVGPRPQLGGATALEVVGLVKTFPGGIRALAGVDLAVTDGEFVTLLGPSGSGKTTLLMLVAGFELPTSGRILSQGRDITEVPPERRDFGVVFQSYALFPHMSVEANVAYPLAARRVRRSERSRLVDETLRLTGMQALKDRRPAQLSGGQQQRVALARALVYRPSVLLLDEPLGALDRALRERMQDELRSLHGKVGVTFIYVTHDQDEALTMSNRIAVLRAGQIEQVGTPEDVYQRPVTPFVATFVGAANVLHGLVVANGNDGTRVRLRDAEVVVTKGTGSPTSGDQAHVVIRPERIHLARAGADTAGAGTAARSGGLEGQVKQQFFAGNVWRTYVSTAQGEIRAESGTQPDSRPGDRVSVMWEPGESWLIAGGAMGTEGDGEHGSAIAEPNSGGSHE